METSSFSPNKRSYGHQNRRCAATLAFEVGGGASDLRLLRQAGIERFDGLFYQTDQFRQHGRIKAELGPGRFE